MIRKLAAAALSATFLVGASTGIAEARAVKVEDRDQPGGKNHFAYMEPFKIKNGVPRRLYVEFNNGSAWVFTPCKMEDDSNCFWWASGRGNLVGNSFVNINGRYWEWNDNSDRWLYYTEEENTK